MDLNKYRQLVKEDIDDKVERPILHDVVDQVRHGNNVSEQLQVQMDQGFWNDMFETTQVSVRPMITSVKTQSIYCVNE